VNAAEVARIALAEDLGERGDVSTRVAMPADRAATAVIAAREEGVLAGCDVADAVADLAGLRMDWRLRDGGLLAAGAHVCVVSGGAHALLGAERTILNLMSRLSGIASLTARYVEACRPVPVLDTRKTTPGLRALEKAAVRAGGGTSHRAGLYDRVMLKDNHLGLMDGDDLAGAVARARAELPGAPVEIEADDLAGVTAALEAGADWILLDNMDAATMRAAVALVAGRARCEASGGMTLERAREAAATGVDAISVGALTHSARALDFGLDLDVAPA
jgi:nicotinate-nucleotide pyrophosphorylase (carboxylating)